jgi:hypothetical protein
MNIPGIIEEAINNTKNRWAEVQNFASLELTGLDAENPEDSRPKLESKGAAPKDISFTPQEYARAFVNNIRGFSGEILSKSLDLEFCKTSYVTPKFEQNLSNAKVMDPQEYFGTDESARKDILLVEYYFKQHMTGEAGGYPSLSKEEYEKTGLYITEALTHYQDLLTEWKKENKGWPGSSTLIRWYIDKMEPYDDQGKNKKKERNRLIDDALQFKSHTPKQIAKTHLPDGEEKTPLMYEETALPDQFIVKDGKIAGAVEVKAYTPEEFRIWVGQLEANLETEQKLDTLTDSIIKTGRLGRNSLQTYIYPGEELPKDVTATEGMRLGVNIDGIRKLVQIANNEPFVIDKVDPETAEVTQEDYNKEYPVVIRVPSDINEADIERMGRVIERLGYANVALQKLPFSVKDLHELGYAYLNRYTGQPRIVESRGFLNEEQLKKYSDKQEVYQTLEELKKRETWERGEQE